MSAFEYSIVITSDSNYSACVSIINWKHFNVNTWKFATLIEFVTKTPKTKQLSSNVWVCMFHSPFVLVSFSNPFLVTPWPWSSSTQGWGSNNPVSYGQLCYEK